MATDPDELAVIIARTEFKNWSDISITHALDGFSTLELTAPFQHDRADFRELFRPFTYRRVEVMLGGEPLFAGRLIGICPEEDPNSSTVRVTAYALPGVLADCTAPARALPLEFKKLGLRAIAEKLAEPYELTVVFRAPEGTRIEKAKLDVDKEIYEFLTDLAQQRNLVISNTTDGAILFWQSAAGGRPVARLASGVPPVTGVGSEFSPQDYFSEITGYARQKKRKKGSRYTLQNPWLTDVLRPTAFRLDDTEKGDAPEETRARMGRMFGNMAAFNVEVATWRDPQGDLWQPNTTIQLTAPGAMVYRETELLTRTVTLRDDRSSRSASLGLALLGAFSGAIPTEIPWQG